MNGDPTVCKFCGEHRLIERIAREWWRCDVCSKLWQIRSAEPNLNPRQQQLQRQESSEQ